MITHDTLAALGIDAGLWGEAIAEALERFDISTIDREQMWLAQVAHESAGFTRLVENLNYSAVGLLNIFPRYFDAESAAQFARRPEAIANRVYANRLGNGPETGGDGWRYRGRGLIQITGKRNYQRCGEALGVDLLTGPDLLCDSYRHAALSAGWFWESNGCNELADLDTFTQITRRINGGLNGLADREEWLRRIRRAM